MQYVKWTKIQKNKLKLQIFVYLHYVLIMMCCLFGQYFIYKFDNNFCASELELELKLPYNNA